MTERSRLEEQLEQAEADLQELAEQVEVGEVPWERADELEAVYRGEISSLRAELESIGSDLPRGRSPRRMLVTGGIVLLSGVAIVLLALQFITPRTGDATLGLAPDTVDLDQISNEAMEAVIAANTDHPQINGMRLALADRYFQEADFRSALPHYQAILETEPDGPESPVAFARIGWMFYQSGGEPEIAVEYLGGALDRAPDYAEARLYLSLVYLYGLEDPSAALPLLSDLAAGDLTPEIRTVVEGALADAEAAAP